MPKSGTLTKAHIIEAFVETNGYTNDIKIVQGRVVSDWWRKKGHSVGIEDIQDILQSKPSVLVIGKGQPGMMRSSRSLRRFLKKNDIEY